MSLDIPKISITEQYNEDSSDVDSDENDMDYGRKSAITDCEDFESGDEDNIKQKTIPKKPTKRLSTASAITDVEDYNDTDSEDEKSIDVPEIQISLLEFLEQGNIEEEQHHADGMVSRSGVKYNDKTFCNNSTNVFDCGDTDCENFNSSGDEISDIEIFEPPNDISYFLVGENLEIADKYLKRKKSRVLQKHKDFNNCDLSDADLSYADLSDADLTDTDLSNADMSNVGVSDADISDTEGAVGEISEVEDLLCSGYEEIIQVQRTDPDSADDDSNSFPVIDVKFVSPNRKCNKRKNCESSRNIRPFLDIATKFEEQLTDIEKLDDSEAENNLSDKDIPIARVAIISEQHISTDTENLDLECETIDIVNVVNPVHNSMIPSAVRELVSIHEEKNGAPITNVMPLSEDIPFGIQNLDNNLCLTDTEEFSGIEDDFNEIVKNCSKKDQIHIFENAFVSNCESMKNLCIKRIDLNNAEQITDTEEIFVAGTVRRRKSKSKNQNKTKSRLLEMKNSVKGSVTDVEEIDISDFELTGAKPKLKKNQKEIIKKENLNIRVKSPENNTDIEYVTGEDDVSISEGEGKSAEFDILLNKLQYMSTVRSVDSIAGPGEKIFRKPGPIYIQEKYQSESNSQYTTDIEDVQLQSDVEENSYSRANTITPTELNEALKECSVSVTHVKLVSSFSIDKEKHHIKGLKDIAETHTDVEFLEDEFKKPDQNNQKESD